MIKLKRLDFYPGKYFIEVLNKLFGKDFFTKKDNDYSEDILATEKGVVNYVKDETTKLTEYVDNKTLEINNKIDKEILDTKQELKEFITTRGYITEKDMLEILINNNIINVITNENNETLTNENNNTFIL